MTTTDRRRRTFRATLAKLILRGPRPPVQGAIPPRAPDHRLPEQRLLDASERYGRILAGDGTAHRGTDASAAGVRTVDATAPSDAGAPVWLRRLGEPAGILQGSVESGESDSSAAQPSGAGRRPRRRSDPHV
jgi:hypothetical protein